MRLECLDRGVLVRVRDRDQLVRVAATARRKADNLPKLLELVPNLPVIFEVQVKEGDAVQVVHITVDVPRCGGGQEEVLSEQFRHLGEGERVETVETVFCCLLLAKANKDVAFLLA